MVYCRNYIPHSHPTHPTEGDDSEVYLEIEMCLEVMLGGGETSTRLAQVQSQLTNITMQLQDMVKAKVVREHVWCTMCHIEGHHRKKCPMMGSYMETGTPNPFPTRPQTEWCEICRQWGHIPPHFPTL
jgi:hypothetical protein